MAKETTTLTISVRNSPGFWDEQRIYKTAAQVYATHGALTIRLLSETGNKNLLAAVFRNYSGGIVKLKRDLGIDEVQRPAGYWTVEAIEREATSFINEYDQLSFNLLTSHQQHSLRHAIQNKYPGSIFALRSKLGISDPISRPPGYWQGLNACAEIEDIARDIANRVGRLSAKVLIREASSGYLRAVVKYYPEGLFGLQAQFNIQQFQKPHGYWTKERIFAEALEIYQNEGRISHFYLTRTKHGSLAHAVTDKYPGGWKQLRLDLFTLIDNSSRTVEEANKDLDSLLLIL